MSLPSLSQLEVLFAEAKTIAIDAYRLGVAAPKVAAGMRAGKSAMQSVVDDAPEILPIVESLANLAFPGSGTAIEVVAKVVALEHPLTQEETNAWMDRFGAGNS